MQIFCLHGVFLQYLTYCKNMTIKTYINLPEILYTLFCIKLCLIIVLNMTNLRIKHMLQSHMQE